MSNHPVVTCVLFALTSLSPAPLRAQELADARWIWGDPAVPPQGDEDAWLFARDLELPAAPTRATAWVTADNRFRLLVNDTVAGRGDDWARLQRLDLTHLLKAGANRLLASCRNEGGPGAFLLALDVQCGDAKRLRFVSGADWRAARPPENGEIADVAKEAWRPAREVAKFGAAPWGELATPPAPTFDPLPGFLVETVAEGFGSVVALAHGGKGRLLANVEGGPLFELLDHDGDGRCEEIKPFTAAIAGCQGILAQPGRTWFTGGGPDGHGLYRLDDGAKAPVKLVAFDGDLGEHGPHAIVEGPDGWLYVAVGNHARLAKPPAASSPYRLTYEGHLLPTFLDPLGHATECKAPGGVVLRIDPESGTCELFAAGFRNHYDLAFDERGELFTFDSDMEWDVGLPWYRPLRVVHVVPGGEYGWRTGSSVWPNGAADSLPPSLEIGRGSPTGMCLATGTNFPERFRGTILAGDWSIGVIWAFRATPRGASYDVTAEPLLRGHPLNVTDLAMDDDGTLLFATGGRGTVGGVHRLRCVEPGATAATNAPAPARSSDDPPARELFAEFARADRDALTRELMSGDRWRRFLAARELERRPGDLPAFASAPDFLSATEIAILEARLQLDRMRRGEAESADASAAGSLRRGLLVPLLMSAVSQPKPEPETRLALLRALQLWRIVDRSRTLDAEKLLTGFPCNDPAADRLWAQLLGDAAPPGAAVALWRAFESEPSREQKIAYADALRCVKEPWPEGAHVEFHRWLDAAIRANTGGMSYVGYLTRIRDEAAKGLTADERSALAAEAAERLKASTTAAAAAAAGSATGAAEPRDFDRVLAFVERTLHAPHRSPADGGLLFQELCSKCHLRGAYGKAVGPDLTTIGARFGPRDLLESLLAPSRTISDQYRGVNLFLKSGDVLTGLPLIADENHVLLVDTLGNQVDVPAEKIERRKPATKSVMPDGLIDPLTLEQVADLCAWLLSPAITAPAAAASWAPLLEPKLLERLNHGSPQWSAADGVIRARTKPDDGGAQWLVDPVRDDFALEFEARLGAADQLFSVHFRTAFDDANPTSPRGLSYAVDGGKSAWGRLRESRGRELLVQPRQEIWWPLPERAGWNHFLITAVGPRITVRLNGTITVDSDDPTGRRDGMLGFELPAGTESAVELRNLRIRDL